MQISFLRSRKYSHFIIGALFAVLSLSFTSNVWGAENPCSFSGYLWGTGARSTFEVYSDTDQLQIIFTWPSGTSDIWIKATDNDMKEVLTDRSLNEGDLLTLTGAGIFHFEIYSKGGGGCWNATVRKIK